MNGTKRLPVMLLMLLAVMSGCGLNTSPGGGEKVGQIVKLARVGMLSKTWEGEIIRGGFTGASGVNGSAFDFTVENDALAARVDSMMQAQAEVKIQYRSEGIWAISRSESSGHFLVDIQRVAAK